MKFLLILFSFTFVNELHSFITYMTPGVKVFGLFV